MGEVIEHTPQAALEVWNDPQLERMINSFTPERIAQNIADQDASGVDPQRIQLWRLGAVMLTGNENDLLRAAQSPTIL